MSGSVSVLIGLRWQCSYTSFVNIMALRAPAAATVEHSHFPLPFNGTLFAAALCALTVAVALRVPFARGRKVARKLVAAPGARVSAGRVRRKSFAALPERRAVIPVAVVPPEFVTRIASGLLRLPTGVRGKARGRVTEREGGAGGGVESRKQGRRKPHRRWSRCCRSNRRGR